MRRSITGFALLVALLFGLVPAVTAMPLPSKESVPIMIVQHGKAFGTYTFHTSTGEEFAITVGRGGRGKYTLDAKTGATLVVDQVAAEGLIEIDTRGGARILATADVEEGQVTLEVAPRCKAGARVVFHNR